MACRLIGANPLSEPMLEYCWLNTYEQTWVKFYGDFKSFIQKIVFEYRDFNSFIREIVFESILC